MTAPKDPFKAAILHGDTWTPVRGVAKMTARRVARARLKRWTQKMLEKFFGPSED